MRLFCKDHTYQHPWQNVTTAFWRKYPNKFSDHIKAVDTVKRDFDTTTGQLTTTRLVSCESSLPSWMTSLGISSKAFAIERTTVHPQEKKMVVQSQNLTGSSIMVVQETCTYTQHADNKDWTNYRQEAQISAFMPIVRQQLENYTLANFSMRSNQGLEVMENLCQQITQQGISSFTSLYRTHHS